MSSATATGVPVPDELIEAVHRAGIAGAIPAAELLHGFANPDTCRWLKNPPAGAAERIGRRGGDRGR